MSITIYTIYIYYITGHLYYKYNIIHKYISYSCFCVLASVLFKHLSEVNSGCEIHPLAQIMFTSTHSVLSDIEGLPDCSVRTRVYAQKPVGNTYEYFYLYFMSYICRKHSKLYFRKQFNAQLSDQILNT